MGISRRLIWVLVFAAIVSAITGAVWTMAWRSALDQLSAKAESDLTLASDRLTSQLFRTRELAVVLADRPELIGLLRGRADPEVADALLRQVADKTGTRALELVDRQGRVVAASSQELRGARLDPAAPPLARALNGALGTANRLGPGPGGTAQRLFLFAAPAFAGPGPAAGAVLAEVDILRLEQNWPTSAAVVFFSNAAGQVIVSNRPELALKMREGPGFPSHASNPASTHTLWALDAGPYLPANALHLSRDLPVIGVTAEILADITPARRSAMLQAAVAAALSLVFGAFLFLATERRRALAASLAQEEAANALLESRVAERTEALVAANRELTREIGERREAEAALQRAQADLVQAGKLSALGQMSAGLSHELNQPLMAIRTFAENGALFLERGKPEQARSNLARISDLARRMDRIIRNLRAFARNEREPMTRVDLVQVVDSAVELTRARLQAENVTLDWQPPAAPVHAIGGEVRLGQVFVNLINNAADAMAGQTQAKQITLRIQAGARPSVTVRDTGPGIADPERIFEPFYTTKEVGAGEGLGLGLSISYGLVQSFGGDIRGANSAGRGAVFTVVLEPWQKERAA